MESQKTLLNLNELGNIYEASFPLSFFPLDKEPLVFSALSNNYIIGFDYGKGGMNIICSLKNHERRINEIFIYENVLYSCSNDSTVCVWDLNSNKLIRTFKKNPLELYSISKSKHILAGATDSKIIFWDLRNMKERSSFSDSHVDEVTKINFKSDFSTILLAGSLDGILALYDLTQENEEESIQMMLNIEQPINYCGFCGDSPNIFAASTIETISLVSLESASVIYQINPIQNTEFNQNYLVDTFFDSNKKTVEYFLGNKNGSLEGYVLSKKPEKISKNVLSHSETIRCTNKIHNSSLIIGAENGQISIVPIGPTDSKSVESLDIETEASEFLIEEPQPDLNEKKKKGQINFNPFK